MAIAVDLHDPRGLVEPDQVSQPPFWITPGLLTGMGVLGTERGNVPDPAGYFPTGHLRTVDKPLCLGCQGYNYQSPGGADTGWLVCTDWGYQWQIDEQTGKTRQGYRPMLVGELQPTEYRLSGNEATTDVRLKQIGTGAGWVIVTGYNSGTQVFDTATDGLISYQQQTGYYVSRTRQPDHAAPWFTDQSHY